MSFGLLKIFKLICGQVQAGSSWFFIIQRLFKLARHFSTFIQLVSFFILVQIGFSIFKVNPS
jgi:hypothetical protein